jgi:hypothetical protein
MQGGSSPGKPAMLAIGTLPVAQKIAEQKVVEVQAVLMVVEERPAA